ncbi:MAG: hypothetical protein JNL11_15460 [Bdellovibrionaceae bacterium]|nr:hypothetical protein [Pseudobdellovibrionaceae bacterium]
MRKILIFALLLIVSCSNQPKNVDNISRGQPPPTNTASIEAKQLAAEEEAYAVTEISFKKGSSLLNVESRDKLENLLNGVESKQKIDKIKVLTWADEEYPDIEQEALSQGQQILVRQRNSKIRNFLRTQKKDLDIEMVSMAERPGILAELWGSSNARMKKSLEAAGISILGKQDKGSPKASKAIIMLILK